MPDEDAIRQRAYELWQQAGMPDGMHEQHWREASEELEGSDANADKPADAATPTEADQVR